MEVLLAVGFARRSRRPSGCSALLWAALDRSGLLWAALRCSALLWAGAELVWAGLGFSWLLWAVLGCSGLIGAVWAALSCYNG